MEWLLQEGWKLLAAMLIAGGGGVDGLGVAVLVVDGDDAERAMVRAVAESLGYDAATVANGAAAWRHYESERESLVGRGAGRKRAAAETRSACFATDNPEVPAEISADEW